MRFCKKNGRYTFAFLKKKLQKFGYWVWFWSCGLGQKNAKKGRYTCVNSRWRFFPTFSPLVSFFLKKGDILVWFCYKKTEQISNSDELHEAGRRFWFFSFKKIRFTSVFLSENILKNWFYVRIEGKFFEKKNNGYYPYTLFLANCSLSVELDFNASIIVYLSLLKQNRRIVCMYVLPFTS